MILRGVNVAANSKVPPFIPFTDASNLDPLSTWGLNVIRLLFTWEAYEPQPGAYNEQYLSQLTAIADAAWARGLYVIIDLHQDAYSRFVAKGCGDGFPSWAIATTAKPSTPDNGPDCRNYLKFAEVVVDPNTVDSFAEFYANTAGVRSRYLRLFQRLAHHFAGHPGVIGYDLLNEPWGDEAKLGQLYEEAAVVIRAADPGAILFIEPDILVSAGVPTRLPQPSFANFSYAPHFYDVAFLASHVYSGNALPTLLGYINMTRQAADFNAPLFIGEIGAYAVDSGAAAYMDLQYHMLDASLLSAAQWNYTPAWNPVTKDGFDGQDLSIVDGNGNIRPNFRIRPYAQRTAGTPLRLTVVQEQTGQPNSIELEWNHQPGIGATVLYVPRQSFFGSAPVKIEQSGSGLSCVFDSSATKVQCLSEKEGLMRVKVRPCSMTQGVCL